MNAHEQDEFTFAEDVEGNRLMAILRVHEWFQLAALAMFASVEMGEWSFYECESVAMCEWPRGVH